MLNLALKFAKTAPTSTATLPSLKLQQATSLTPIRQWLDQIEIRDAQFAHWLCQMIPTQCPFERDIKVFGRTLLRIPPLCKLNPFYGELMSLRFRALCYLADECGEDIRCYC